MSQYPICYVYTSRKFLKTRHLKNNQKKFDKLFCQLKNLYYFCTRFQRGSKFIRIDQKIFQKTFCQFKKRLYFCTRFQKRELSSKNRLKNFFKKVLVEQKKGCTFAPAFKTSERRKRLKKFSKKIWSIEKKVISLHPQTKRQVH